MNDIPANPDAKPLIPGAGAVRPRSPQSVIPFEAVNSNWRKLAFWIRTTAVVSLLFGGFQLFVGLINFGWGTFAGMTEIALAVIMFVLAGQAHKMSLQPQDLNELNRFAKQLIVYFRLQSLFIVLFAIAMILLVVTILQFLTDWDWLIHLIKQGKKLDRLIVQAEKWYAILSGWISKWF